ncbi:MAG TPA: hypothetical protein PLZ36_02665 [Armatimonadota bacterium]|nr:hypothetical protein [Armatimonadota bacterium]HOS43159.1 hypothetical protein [Armatimonadota bacterium]
MRKLTLKRLLQEAVLEEIDTIPGPGHTVDCLGFEDARRLADGLLPLSDDIGAHLRTCAHCAKLLKAFRQTMPSTTTSQIMGHWPREMLAKLEHWVRETVAREQRECATAASFDADGALHVRLSGLAERGTVIVYLIWNDQELALTEGAVRDGTLTIDDATPQIRLTNLDIPAALLRIRPISMPV